MVPNQTSVGAKRKMNELRWHIYNHSYWSAALGCDQVHTETRGYVSSSFPLQGAQIKTCLRARRKPKNHDTHTVHLLVCDNVLGHFLIHLL